MDEPYPSQHVDFDAEYPIIDMDVEMDMSKLMPIQKTSSSIPIKHGSGSYIEEEPVTDKTQQVPLTNPNEDILGTINDSKSQIPQNFRCVCDGYQLPAEFQENVGLEEKNAEIFALKQLLSASLRRESSLLRRVQVLEQNLASARPIVPNAFKANVLHTVQENKGVSSKQPVGSSTAPSTRPSSVSSMSGRMNRPLSHSSHTQQSLRNKQKFSSTGSTTKTNTGGSSVQSSAQSLGNGSLIDLDKLALKNHPLRSELAKSEDKDQSQDSDGPVLSETSLEFEPLDVATYTSSRRIEDQNIFMKSKNQAIFHLTGISSLHYLSLFRDISRNFHELVDERLKDVSISYDSYCSFLKTLIEMHLQSIHLTKSVVSHIEQAKHVVNNTMEAILQFETTRALVERQWRNRKKLDIVEMKWSEILRGVQVHHGGGSHASTFTTPTPTSTTTTATTTMNGMTMKTLSHLQPLQEHHEYEGEGEGEDERLGERLGEGEWDENRNRNRTTPTNTKIYQLHDYVDLQFQKLGMEASTSTFSSSSSSTSNNSNASKQTREEQQYDWKQLSISLQEMDDVAYQLELNVESLDMHIEESQSYLDQCVQNRKSVLLGHSSCKNSQTIITSEIARIESIIKNTKT